ncbi:MAG TPA: hypothetical protein VFZ09_20265 [Archangium sp.]|uniref:hypothetical protein n=1 Tax=Archangium sp. TaxID=1872627 RepID=UPI002E2F9106|nr:hypothetical protein [Archangium sp.]HEX5748586.1 hypothetical protein [Archangium sp.]
MREMWRNLGAVLALSLAACGDPNDGGGNGNTVCTGTYSGALTGRVSFCSLEATRLASGQLQYNLQIDPAPGSGTVQSNDNILITLTGEPKTGTLTGTAISQALGSVYSSNDRQYTLQQGLGGESLGLVSLTIDSVPGGQSAGNGNTLYQWFGGKAQIRYAAPAGAGYTGTVDLSLDFKPQ